jgi:Ca2+-binding RTX toxin-like protein/subtilisin-like proprotein convertase family protein
MPTYPSDPLFAQQWHLYNPSGLDLNVVNVWDDYTGQGVLVGVIDDGFDYNHSDLNDNYDTSIDYDYNDNDSTPFGNSTDAHGTAVSGIIGAEAGNGIGGVGVAFNATITGFRATNIVATTNALWDSVYLDVVNNSWGFGGNFTDNFYSSSFSSAGAAIVNAVANGRGGLGTAIVFAAGNSRSLGDNTNYHNFQNSPGVITVAAVKADGYITSYSTPGASILVSAFGSEPSSIFTTDRTGSAGYSSGDYTTSFDGTSAAAPMVSGVVALMLEANPNLGYRDIQEILAYSARQTGSSSSYATNGANNWNGGGLHVSHDYGFGLVDALAAVRLAETWQTQSRFDNEYYMFASRSLGWVVPDNNSVGISDTVTMGAGLDIDFIEVDLNLTHSYRGDLVVTLTSPDGTESVLVNRPGITGNGSDNGDNIVFRLSSSHHWGETSGGNWTLKVKDLASGDVGILNGWTLYLYGDLDTADDTYIYTNEFGNYTTSSRKTLTDTSGIDTINAAAITSNSYLDLTPGAVSTLDGSSLTISTGTVIEKAFSGDGNDTIIGNSAANTLDGGRGNDNLIGSSGNDTVIGGKGNDILDGGVGNDSLKGGIGDDGYFIDSAGDTIVENANEGTDVVISTVTYTLGANLEGLGLSGTGNINGTGNSLNNVVLGNTGNNILDGGTGNDLVDGDAGNDTLTGGSGNDTLTGGSGTNSLSGGTGNDLYIIDLDTSATITEFANEGIDTVQSSLGINFGGASLENLTLTGTANINGTGNASNNTMAGNSGNNNLSGLDGNDSLSGSAGNDTLNGGTGNDTMTGGTGDDTYVVDSSLDVINEINNEGIDTVQSSVSFTLDSANALNSLTLTGTANINGTGNGNNNIITGNSGNNNLDGGTGNDTMTGGAGDDGYIIDSAGDTIVENANEGTDVVVSAVTYTLGANLEGLGLSGTGNINGTGNSLNNVVLGNSGNNTLKGVNGHDSLDGGDGNDKLTGGNGNDTLNGGNGTDTVVESGNANFTLTNSQLTGLGTNSLTSVEKANLTGGTGNNQINASAFTLGAVTLNGKEGNDTLLGSNKNDTLTGGVGSDTLTGGAGNDRFTFNSSSEGIDQITDFLVVNDTIDVKSAGFGGGLIASAAITAAQFLIGTAATTANQRFIYDSTNGGLFFDQDGTGAIAQLSIATLTTGLAMTNADIFVIA